MEQSEPKNGEVTLETLATMIKGGFDEVHKRIDGVESSLTEKIDNLENSLREDMQLGFASVNRRMDSFVEKVAEHEERFAKME